MAESGSGVRQADGLSNSRRRVLITRRSQDDETIYLYSGWQCIEEREYDALDEEWQSRRQFIYGPRFIDDLVIFENYDTTAEVWVSYYYVAKANYTIATLTDDSGEPVERYLYDAYGVPSLNDGARQPVVSRVTDNPYLFHGRRYDPETGLYYYRNRYYSPALGRFMQRPSLWLSHSQNALASSQLIHTTGWSSACSKPGSFQEAPFPRRHALSFQIHAAPCLSAVVR